MNNDLVNMDFAIVTPMANEEEKFQILVDEIKKVLDDLRSGKAYFVVDKASHDNTLLFCKEQEKKDNRFKLIWSPENKNVVDAYMKGFQVAYEEGHAYFIEMDAGMSHNPKAIIQFLKELKNGFECVFGSRFITGGGIYNSKWHRTFFSKKGTTLSNLLLGTKLNDMTSGFQGFSREVVGRLIEYNLLSKGHFYQTEVRFLLRNRKSIEIPIHYNSPSPRLSLKSIMNSIRLLVYYSVNRLFRKSPEL